MNLVYEGKDITDKVELLHADIRDSAGGEADSMELQFSDTDKLWREWNPQKGAVLSVKQNGFGSGAIFVDFLQDMPGVFILKGRSTPLHAKTCKTRSWENIRFLQMATDIANNYGFKINSQLSGNWLYDRLDQIEATDFGYLSERCILEGYCLKISDKELIIYEEGVLEKAEPVLTLTPQDFKGPYNVYSTSEGLFTSCIVKYWEGKRLASCTFTPDRASEGPVLKPEIKAFNLAEAQRFAKGCLRSRNKWETFGDISIDLNTGIAAGNTIELKNMGGLSGIYFIHNCVHKLLDNKTSLRIRKTLEGY